jgi:hypothetical protein
LIRSNCTRTWISAFTGCTSGTSPGLWGLHSPPSPALPAVSDWGDYETWSPSLQCSATSGSFTGDPILHRVRG